MKQKLLLVGICCLMLLGGGCVNTSSYDAPILPSVPTPTPPSVPAPVSPDVSKRTSEIKLSQAVIDAAVAECQDKTTWGINLAKVRIEYVTGVNVGAVIVLHNGDDTERLVKVSYQPTYHLTDDGETGIIYEPTPIEAYGWVTIDTKKLRLQKMETEVIPIHLYVPENFKDLPDYWEFDISAQGIEIQQYEYKSVVTTEIDDTILSLQLPMPLLDDSVGSILGIKSSLDESLYVIDYDVEERTLVIGGLKEQSVRDFAITYEYGRQIITAYNQRWLIAMMR